MEKPFGPFSRLCRIPRELGAITAIADEADPREVSLSRDQVESLWESVEAVYRTGLHPAIQVCIRHEGRVVLHRAVGHARGNDPDDAPDTPKVPISTDTPFVLYSASKAVTALLVLKLDELGVLHVEDRVCDYVPEFAKQGKDQITIRHVLTHRAGIPGMPVGIDRLADAEGVMIALCEAKPSSRPGRFLAYHAVSGGYVLATVVERATGRDIRTALRKHIADPLGLPWMNYGVAAEKADALALDAFTGPPEVPPFSWLIRRALGASLAAVVEVANGGGLRTAIIPSANLVSTADELSKFYMCMADEGAAAGGRVFDPRTIRRATAEQSYYEIDLTLGAPMRWGLGVMLGGPISLFGLDTPRAFGHLGFTNILTWADPERRLGVAILNSGKPFISLGTLPLASLVMQIGRMFPKR